MNLGNLNPFRKIKELGLAKFTIIWGGQALSIIGSDMSGFAMTLWLWDATGKATPMVLMMLIRTVVVFALVPFAGSIVDRFNRKTVLVVSDAGGALVTAVTMVLLLIGEMSVSIVYVVGFLNQVFNVFHNIANEAMKVQIVPKEQLGRAAGMTSFSDSFSGVVAPVFAAALVPLIGYVGVYLIDLVSFAFAFTTICLVKVPNVKMPDQQKKNIFADIVEGFKYIFNNKTLTWIVINGTLTWFFFQFGCLIVIPMLLARIGGQTLTYGFVQSVWSIAGIVGALVLSFWGGPKKKRFFISIFFTLGFAIGMIIVGMGTNPWVWCIGGSIWYISSSLGSIRNAFYATKVPVHMQGRFYAARLNANHMLSPIPYIFGGQLADKVFEPLMANPSFSSKFSWLVRTGKGSGMGLMMVISGILTLLVMSSAFLIKPIREADNLLPDVNVDIAKDCGES